MKRIFPAIVMPIFLLMVIPSGAYAWEFAGWYGGGCYPTLVADPHKSKVLFLGSDVAGIWKSMDGGAHWVSSSRGLGCLNVAVITVGDHLVYAGTKSGLYKSIDGGIHWMDDSRGENLVFERPGSHRGIYLVPGDDSQVVLGTASGDVYVSSSDGKKWTKLGTKPFGQVSIDSVVFSKKYGGYFAISKKGLAYFDPNIKQWRIVFGEQTNDMIMSAEDVLYVATGNTLIFSRDGAKSWTRMDAVPSGAIARIDVRTIGKEAKIIAGIGDGWLGGVCISEDGKTWANPVRKIVHAERDNPTRKWMKGFQKPTSISFDAQNNQVLYYTDWWGVWRTDDFGKTWQEIIHGASNVSGSDLFIDDGGRIYVGTMDQGVLSSKDGGASYDAFLPNQRFPEGGHAWRVEKNMTGTLLVTFTPWKGRAFEVMTGDDKNVKNESNKGLPIKAPIINTMWGRGYPRALAFDVQAPGFLFLGIDGNDGGGLFVSEDNGNNWKRFQNQPGSLRIYNGLAVAGNKIYWGASGKGGGVYISEDYGQSWTNRLPSLSWVFDIARTSGGVIFAAGGDGKSSIYRSKDDGITWRRVFAASNGDACEALAVHPSDIRLIAAGVVNWNEKAGGRVIFSKDGGDSWVDATGNLPESTGPAAVAFNKKDGYLYVLLYAGSVYKMKVDTN